MTCTIRRLFVSLNLYIAGAYNNDTEADRLLVKNMLGMDGKHDDLR
jgi:hypothetical protein